MHNTTPRKSFRLPWFCQPGTDETICPRPRCQTVWLTTRKALVYTVPTNGSGTGGTQDTTWIGTVTTSNIHHPKQRRTPPPPKRFPIAKSPMARRLRVFAEGQQRARLIFQRKKLRPETHICHSKALMVRLFDFDTFSMPHVDHGPSLGWLRPPGPSRSRCRARFLEARP